ncbi:multidrug ABC transporter ATP-binding protein [Alkalihalobacillus alcalophilus ATCC 27647 = CGMCC 1.3604]|uniref:Multidrug ABC transporter ATP-binding protein n=1 Tax=Alkalihalobacillus alcalophilus ATCC 27647 = CGMCC 1.3604 TaxID=1218173 RepID=J8THM3_ALKAL|nr:ABC-F family ATP-binding cassette domain-containing protein [Alkalihalobacillus alcalophilus]AFV25865.1 unknown transporter [Alkalihalobacillus alcalophilus ATCC 27647 = CGMCC 1.3604]KGA97780.1 multidrug ABC transporter ATP-binding protein [Alkalihalobacillus alcalophilus ATCC 27647 = CGMCC 1.3604]MED1562457.1 ABC-F family ATP-binding cassette domain-containing protein [Alkalihalobacillus alcalophilus]THG90754.1 multidrug ABC transporter ATP-binding protein [Alkalihalobacillus alcalophilus A
MIILQCVNISKSFGAEPILSNIKLEVQTGERIALVGRNGAGKSTLLKIIAGQLSYDGGDIIKPKEVELGYLAQDTGLESTLSIWDEMLTVFAALIEMEQKLRTLEQQMSDPKLQQDEIAYSKILSEYDELQIIFKDKGGYQYEADIRGVLSGLNFSSFRYDTKISNLSGGQKTRLALGKLLLTKPDLLILDEPTNHLDIETLTWLEQYLSNYKGAILIVSHDRYFLDQVVGQVVEISRTKSTKFPGNYSAYLDEKAKRYELELKQFEKQQEQIAKLEDFVQRNIARASTTKRAQSRRKQLERIDKLDRPSGSEKSANFIFDIDKQTGNEVLRVSDLEVCYDKTPIFSELSLEVNRGESVAVVGPNGAGKSTLLKTLTKQLKETRGTIKLGSNVKIGYYDQEQAKLHSNKQVLHELWDEYSLHPEKEIRTVLGNFLFSGDDVLKPVSSLSGGEKARLALAKLMMQKANFLILDEPTNHLDLDAKEVLESALIDYPGTLLFVSHDRYFLNRIATRVTELDSGTAIDYLGDYDYYIEKKAENKERIRLREAENTPEEKQAKTTSFTRDKEVKRQERQRLRRIEEIETTIEKLEIDIAVGEELLCNPEVYADHEKALEIQTKIDEAKAATEQLMEEWETLQIES